MGSVRDRLAIAAALAAIALVAVLAPPSAEYDPRDLRRSSYHSSPPGARGIYLALRELDVPVERLRRSFTGAGALGDGPIALLAPAEPPSPAELLALGRWLEAGGTLIYAAGRSDDPTLDSLGLRIVSPSSDSTAIGSDAGPATRAQPTESHVWLEGVDAVGGFRRTFHDSSAVLLEDGATPLLVTENGAVVVVFRRGRGTIVAWSDAAPLANRSIRESGAAVVFSRMAADRTGAGRPLVFDEYHQGYRGDGSTLGATGRFLRDTRAGHATLQLAVAGVLLLLLYGRRLGEPMQPPARARRSPLEHVDALAAAYRQADARTTVRRLLVGGLARRLGRPAPDGPEDEARLIAVLERRRRIDPGRLRRLRDELHADERADLAALARDIDHLIEEVHGP